MTRRRFAAAMLGGTAALLAGCERGGHIRFLGYTSAPPFDPNIRSVYLPVFKLAPVVTTPLRGLDVELTEAIVQELNSRKSPIKVISDSARADTILIGTIASVTKSNLSLNQQALPLESELSLTVDVVWRDQRSGEVLSNPRGKKPPSGAGAFDPSAVATPEVPKDEAPTPVRLTATGRFIIQNGESTATGADMAVKKMARLIVNMMEAPWQLR